MFKGKTIKHKRYLDIAFMVTYQLELENDYKLEGFIINQAYVNSFIITSEHIRISKQDIGDWLYCLTPKDQCIRYSKWEPVV